MPGFLAKIESYAPVVVAFNGEKAAKVVARCVREAVAPVDPAMWAIGAIRVYRLPSSSSAAAKIGLDAKRRAWEAFGHWVRGLS